LTLVETISVFAIKVRTGEFDAIRTLEPVRSAYEALGAGAQLRIMEGEPAGLPAARWLLQQLPGN
jgi:hypothetical protein